MAVLDPDGFTGMNEYRLVQDEVTPSVDKCEAISLLTVDWLTLLDCTHGNSIGSMPASNKPRLSNHHYRSAALRSRQVLNNDSTASRKEIRSVAFGK
ncbi:hypothetical protein ACLQ3B_00780 [Micromonospora sp. DT53]|uniref:hypothetical protein n=1 Tax=Micromonospora sp. DT53 TaxID=3393444 RepID=UPI003CE6B5AC